MENTTERSLGHLFGLVGGVLILVGGFVALVFGIADLAIGHVFGAAAAVSGAVVLFVVGVLVLLFSHLGEHGLKERPLTTGVLLVVLAIVGWAALGLGSNVVAVVGGVFALLAGVLYLIEPTRHAASAIVSAS
jgi:hypothetical protein